MAPIEKTIIHAGEKYVPIEDGSKVYFHFQTWKLGRQRILLDDSKLIGKKEPMVLVIGHKFKLEVWESVVKMMAIGEVSSFKVKRELVFSYPFVSKTMRELNQDKKVPKHTCTMTFHTEGIGYPDLDEIISAPADLEFIIGDTLRKFIVTIWSAEPIFTHLCPWDMLAYRSAFTVNIMLNCFSKLPDPNSKKEELLKVEKPNEYEKDIWQHSDAEKLHLVPKLREKGNNFYKEKMYEEAELAYSKALGICEQLMVRERKTDAEWIRMNDMKLPLLLNYSQLQLLKGNYYTVIEHCNTVLEYDKNNEKALYRRGKAHVGAWNPDLAEEDFKKLKALNPSMTAVVDKELDNLFKLRKERLLIERDAMKKLFAKDA